jgi:RNA polymerase sigma factor (sigma-70 family)
MTDEQKLLHRYTVEGSRDALDELIRRYQGLVYSAAVRQVHDSHLAEDVTQAVFLVLAEKSGGIRHEMALGGWLLTVTRRAALHAMKKQTTQHRHERAAARGEMTEPVTETWNQIAPVIDGALAGLSGKNRDAVVMRFFQDRSFAEIGTQLGLSEDAARKRVARGLEHLKAILSRRGPTLSLAALSMAISTHAVKAAPPSVAAVVVGGAGSSTPQSVSIAKGVIKMIAYPKARIIAAVAASVVLGGTGIVVLNGVFADGPSNAAPAGGASVAAAPTTMPATASGTLIFSDRAQTPVLINLNDPLPDDAAGVTQVTIRPAGATGGRAGVAGGAAVGGAGGTMRPIMGGGARAGAGSVVPGSNGPTQSFETVIVTVPVQHTSAADPNKGD